METYQNYYIILEMSSSTACIQCWGLDDGLLRVKPNMESDRSNPAKECSGTTVSMVAHTGREADSK